MKNVVIRWIEPIEKYEVVVSDVSALDLLSKVGTEDVVTFVSNIAATNLVKAYDLQCSVRMDTVRMVTVRPCPDSLTYRP